jgi:hypothetical protein
MNAPAAGLSAQSESGSKTDESARLDQAAFPGLLLPHERTPPAAKTQS